MRNSTKTASWRNKLGSTKKQDVMEGALVLTLGLAMVKLIGALFRIPLGSMLDQSGMGYFTTAYTVYVPVYTLATAGLPSAVARQVSAQMQRNRYNDVRKTRKVVMKVFLFTGIIGSAVLLAIGLLFPYLISAGIFNEKTTDPNSVYSLLAIFPAVFFCALMSGYRGYYQGMRNMVPTAVSEIIEAFSKLIFGLGGTFAVIKYAELSYAKDGTFLGVPYDSVDLAKKACYPYAAAAAIAGVTLGAVFGYLYMRLRYKKFGDGITDEMIAQSVPAESGKQILKTLLRFGIPIALGVLTMNITQLIDMITIQWQLGNIILDDPDFLRSFYTREIDGSTVKLIGDTVLNNEIPNYLYGSYGYTTSLFNLVPTVVQAFGVSVLPALAAFWIAKDYEKIKDNVTSVLKIASLIAMPAGLGMSALAPQLLNLLYFDKFEMVQIASPMLRVMGISTILFALITPINSMLQAIGKQDLPVKLMLIGSGAKLIVNTVLIRQPEINIMGAPYGTLVCHTFILLVSIIVLIRSTKIKLDIIATFIKPMIAGAMCAAAAYLSNSLLDNFISSERLVTIIALVIAVVVYVVAILALRAVTEHDLKMIPKGEKIAKYLKIKDK